MSEDKSTSETRREREREREREKLRNTTKRNKEISIGFQKRTL